MEVGEEREALAGFPYPLCAELGYPIDEAAADEVLAHRDEGRGELFAGLLGADDERLIATARRSLARIAAALKLKHPVVISDATYWALLDGAELVMRRELVAGNRVSTLMPSFVFLVALPIVQQEVALELSRRTASLLDVALG